MIDKRLKAGFLLFLLREEVAMKVVYPASSKTSFIPLTSSVEKGFAMRVEGYRSR